MSKIDGACSLHAKNSLILGHIHSGMGEKTQCLKLKELLNCSCIDLFDFFQDLYEPLAKLNFNLAESGLSLIEGVSLKEVGDIKKKLPPFETLFILSWSFSVAAAFAAGIHQNKAVIVKLYAHHEEEKIFPTLYEPADLVITESLLACKRAFAYGIAKEKVLHLPHHYPEECEGIKASRSYALKLAKQLDKKIGQNTRIIGAVFRLECGKNCEYALEAVRSLVGKGKDVVLILKGDFPKETPHLDYQLKLKELLCLYDKEPWLLWDRSHSPFPQVLEEYSSFDLLLHLSGAEGGSNVIVECLGLKKAVVALECSTNPYLFKDIVTFVKTTGVLQHAQLPFFVPDFEDLLLKLEGPLPQPNPEIVKKRFHIDVTKKRLPLLFQREGEKIKRLYEQDLELFHLSE